MKYLPNFPDHFESLEHARQFLAGFFFLDFRSYEATRWGLTCWFAFCSGVA